RAPPRRKTGGSEAERPLDVVQLGSGLPSELLAGPAEVAVGRRAPVDGAAQVEVADDGGGAEVEDLFDHGRDVEGVDSLGAEGLDHDRHGPGHADGVGDLD